MSNPAYRSAVRWCLFAWIGVAVALTGFNAYHGLHSVYGYGHGWISAHFSLAARNFATFGIGALGGVPVVNNPPFGISVEAYLHWPPLFHYALAGVYRVFDASEAVSHASMFVLLLLNTLCLGLLVRRCSGVVAAQFAALAWLGCNVVVQYAHLVWNVHLMVLFVLLSLLGFVNARDNWKWALAGAGCYALAVATSWEAVFIFPGLLAAGIWTRDKGRIRLASIYALIAVIVPALILLNSAYHYPQQMAELWQRAIFRMGLAHDYVSTYVTSTRRQLPVPGILTTLRTLAERLVDYIGILPLMAVAWLVVLAAGNPRDGRGDGRGDDGAFVLAGLVSMWWLWFVLFRSHVFIHDCQMLVAAPAAAMAAGVVGRSLVKLVDGLLPDGARARRMFAVAVVPLVLLLPLARAIHGPARIAGPGAEERAPNTAPNRDVQLGLDLLRNTERGSVVILPEESAVPLYYSERHLIQGVDSEEDFRSAIVYARKNFPGAPLFLAIPDNSASRYAGVLAEGKLAGRFSGMTLVKVAGPAGE